MVAQIPDYTQLSARELNRVGRRSTWRGIAEDIGYYASYLLYIPLFAAYLKDSQFGRRYPIDWEVPLLGKTGRRVAALREDNDAQVRAIHAEQRRRSLHASSSTSSEHL